MSADLSPGTSSGADRPRLGWTLFDACATIVAAAILCALITHYAYWPGGVVRTLFSVLSIFWFPTLMLAPLALLVPLAIEIVRGERRVRKLGAYIGLIVVAVAFHPIAQQLPGIDVAYAESMLRRGESLNLVGKPKEEVVALLGPPSYVLPIKEFPGEEQLRYRHWLPILWQAEFFVSVKGGRAELLQIDWD